MQNKLFFLTTLFVVSFATTYTNDTPYILIGNWTFVNTTASDSSPCCPTGNLFIFGDPNNQATLTSTNWTGECSRSSSYQEIISVNWQLAYEQLVAEYNNGDMLPAVFDIAGSMITINMTFLSNGTTMNLLYDSVEDGCSSEFVKSSQGQIMGIFAAVLIAWINIVIA